MDKLGKRAFVVGMLSVGRLRFRAYQEERGSRIRMRILGYLRYYHRRQQREEGRM
jgi:hypothetical protein